MVLEPLAGSSLFLFAHTNEIGVITRPFSCFVRVTSCSVRVTSCSVKVVSFSESPSCGVTTQD